MRSSAQSERYAEAGGSNTGELTQLQPLQVESGRTAPQDVGIESLGDLAYLSRRARLLTAGFAMP